MITRQKSGAPEPRIKRLGLLVGVLIEQNDKRGQVRALRPKPIARPRAEGRPAGLLMAGLEKRDCRVVVDRLRKHRLDDADVVGNLVMKWQQIADPLPTFAVLPKRRDRVGGRKRTLPRGHSREPLAHTDRIGQVVAAELLERGLVVKRIDLRRRPRLEEINHPLGLGPEMDQTRASGFVAGPVISGARRPGRNRRRIQKRRPRPPALPWQKTADAFAIGELRLQDS